ncbi:MAG: hypothetical protein AAFR38_09605 [Planctomycetota bacterium]
MKNAAALAIAAAAGAVAAQSDPAVLSFTYSDLNGSFDGSTFSAVAQGATSGDVTRLDQGPADTADFNSGFNAGLASAAFDISVGAIMGGFGPFTATADGAGSFTLTDTSGDTIQGQLRGQWFRSADGQLFFNGFTTGVVVTTNDGSFDGQSGSGFSTFGLEPIVLDGTVVVLSFDPSFSVFGSTFDGISTQISGRLTGEPIPSPGSLAIVAAGGLIAARRRR